MARKKIHVVDEGSLHKYRTEIPNTIIRGLRGRNLTRDACWLYVYLKSVTGDAGECWQSRSLIAKGAKMSTGMVSKCKQELSSAGLISIKQGSNIFRDADRIKIHDIWNENMLEFSGYIQTSPHDALAYQENSMPVDVNDNRGHHMTPQTSPHDAQTSPHDGLRRSHEEDPIKNKSKVLFDLFWDKYPVKKGKRSAATTWKRLKLDDRAQEVITSVQNHTDLDEAWSKGFIPHPTTYLNQGRWEDDLTAAASKTNQACKHNRGKVPDRYADDGSVVYRCSHCREEIKA